MANNEQYNLFESQEKNKDESNNQSLVLLGLEHTRKRIKKALIIPTIVITSIGLMVLYTSFLEQESTEKYPLIGFSIGLLIFAFIYFVIVFTLSYKKTYNQEWIEQHNEELTNCGKKVIADDDNKKQKEQELIEQNARKEQIIQSLTLGKTKTDGTIKANIYKDDTFEFHTSKGKYGPYKITDFTSINFKNSTQIVFEAKKGYGKMVLGGVLFGAAGAIAGSLATSNKSKEINKEVYYLQIGINDLKFPGFAIDNIEADTAFKFINTVEIINNKLDVKNNN